MRIRRPLAAALVAASPLVVQAMDVPDAVKPPMGHKPVMTWTGTGLLTYECRAKPDNAAEFAWTFAGPDAKLTDAKTMAPTGKYYGGPTWEANDGGKVTGKQVAIAPAAPGNIPLQLVKTESGSGMLKDVTYIQRVNTKGGVAPADPCNASTAGKRTTVPYAADYVFFRAG
jgi:hypothetical protein